MRYKLPTGCKRNHTFHVNMLRKWHSPSAASFLTKDIASREPDDVIFWDCTSSEDREEPLLCKELSSSQRQELTHLLQQFADVLSSHTSITQTTECRIRTETAAPIGQCVQ